MDDIKYDEQKLMELMLYVALKCQDDKTFGNTKLNKILFFSDFCAFRKFGHPITGAVYQKLEHGPAPRRLLPAAKTLESDKRAGWQAASLGRYNNQKRLIALQNPNLSLFAAEEIALVDWVVDQLAGKTGKEVSDLSHELPGWQCAEMGEDIPYFTACLPSTPEPLTQDELDWATEVAATI